MTSPTPKHIGSAVAGGTSVPADFSLPWNTTRTMADVFADETHAKLSAAGKRGAEVRAAKARKQFVEDYQKRMGLTPRGKIPFAGYDASEVW